MASLEKRHTHTEFFYEAENALGEFVQGTISANDRHDAFSRLRARQLEPIKVDKFDNRAGFWRRILGGQIWSNKKLLNQKQLPFAVWVRVFKKLAALSKARAPLLDCLQLCAKQESHIEAKSYLARLAHAVQAGASLSSAMNNDVVVLPRLVYALVLTAERTGDFYTSFLRVSMTLDQQEKTRKDVVAQLVYPLVLTGFVIATLFFISFFVLPQFEKIFASAEAKPPAFTAAVLATGQFIREFTWLFPLVTLLLLLGGKALSIVASEALDRLALRLVGAGQFLRLLNAERYCRSLGALLVGGTPLVDAFPIATQAIASPNLRLASERVADQVKSGIAISESVQKEALLPEDIISLLEIGERSGTLGEMALSAADLCQESVESKLKKFSALLGPLLTALAGALVAVVIAAIMSGILSLNETIY